MLIINSNKPMRKRRGHINFPENGKPMSQLEKLAQSLPPNAKITTYSDILIKCLMIRHYETGMPLTILFNGKEISIDSSTAKWPRGFFSVHSIITGKLISARNDSSRYSD